MQREKKAKVNHLDELQTQPRPSNTNYEFDRFHLDYKDPHPTPPQFNLQDKNWDGLCLPQQAPSHVLDRCACSE